MSSRFTFRRSRSVRLESLESREVLSAGGPTSEAQYMLELINLARTNPPAAAQWIDAHADSDVKGTLAYYGVDLKAAEAQIASAKAVPPVGWSDTLAATAMHQSADQVATGVQSHYGANGSTLGQRLDQAGYTGRASDGENAFAYAKSVDNAMEAFLVDWGVADQGHRRNILQPNATPAQYYREAGIGIDTTNSPNMGPKVITVDFARQANSKPELLGVAYNDLNGNGSYDMGEGQGNVEVDATNLATGQKYSTLTYDNGGAFQLNLDPGQYDVRATLNGRLVRDQTITLYDQNVKVDYNLSLPWQGSAPSQPAAQVSSAPVSAAMMTAPAAPTPPPPPPPPVAPVPQTIATPPPPAPTPGAQASVSSASGGWSAWTAGQS
jgi:uncharacterized protein YkwD